MRNRPDARLRLGDRDYRESGLRDRPSSFAVFPECLSATWTNACNANIGRGLRKALLARPPGAPSKEILLCAADVSSGASLHSDNAGVQRGRASDSPLQKSEFADSVATHGSALLLVFDSRIRPLEVGLALSVYVNRDGPFNRIIVDDLGERNRLLVTAFAGHNQFS